MVTAERFIEGMACLTQAEDLLDGDGAGFPPTTDTLADLRTRLARARRLIDQASVLLEMRNA